MSYNSISTNPASGAGCTQVQEQVVKSFSSSSSNFNNDVEVEEFDLKDYVLTYFDGSPAVYVGTYGKYNSGSLRGAWLKISAFTDYEEFLAVCRYLHRDEADPEFMAQDFCDFPREFYTEGFMSEREFDVIQEFAKLDDDDKEAFEVYVAAFGSSKDDCSIFDTFREAYQGKWDSEEDFTYNLVEELCLLDNAPEFVKNYFNYSAFARDLFIEDYYFDSQFVFRRL